MTDQSFQATQPLPGATRLASETYGYMAGPRYAGFWIRLGANLIDSVILFVAAYSIMFAVGFAGVLIAKAAGIQNSAAWIQSHSWIGSLFGFAMSISYYTLFVGGRWAATPGKRICGLYVTRDTGAKVSHLRALGRFFAYYLSEITLFIGFLMIGWTAEKTGLHDLICATRVVHGKAEQQALARETLPGVFA